MRPVRLSLAGLHSFRKAQTIDFNQVSDAGVFGVFGPTGSGKSTILDAMTLALFGNVERSDKNRVGIINQQEDKIHVKLSFELNDQTYTVERVYARNGELRVKSTLARLSVLENGEEVVLADKENEVTNSVESLLGLEVKDFTRAVILPQGKFAEFLTLKSQERRPMLERLFHLNDYGKKLKDRAQAKENYLKKERDEMVAKQEMLKHASKEKLEEEKANLNQLKKEKKEKEDQLELFLSSFKQVEEKWKLTQKLLEIQKHLFLLKEKEAFIHQLERKRDKAERAGKLESLIQNNERLAIKQEELKKIIDQVNNQLESIVLQEKTEKERYEQAMIELAQKEPELTKQLFQLKEAVNWEEEIAHLEIELNELHEKIALVEEELNRNLKASENNKKQLEISTPHYNQLQAEIQSIFVSSEERNMVEQAWEVRNRIIEQQKIITQWLAESDKTEVLIDQKKIKQATLNEELKKCLANVNDIELKQELTNRFAPISQEDWHKKDKLLLEIQGVIDKISLTSKEIREIEEEKKEVQNRISQIIFSLEEKDKLFNEKDQQLQALIKQMEQLKQNDVIQQLISELEPGKPCLVCGSTTHHQPTKNNLTRDQEKLRILDERVKQENEVCSTLLVEKNTLETKREVLAEQLINSEHKRSEKQKIIESLITSLPSSYQQQSIEQLKEKFDEEKEEHDQLQEKIAAYLIEQEQENHRIQEINDQISKLNSDQQVLTSELTLYLTRKQEIQDQLEIEQQKIEELEQQWKQFKKQFSFDTLVLRREEIKNNDQKREGLEAQKHSLEEALKKLENTNQRLSEVIQQQQLEREYLTNSVNEKRSRLDDFKRKVEQIAGGKKAKEALVEVEQQLQQIKHQVKMKEETWRNIKEELAELDKQLATEIAVHHNVSAQLKDSNFELAHKLKEDQWETVEEVKQSLISVQELAQLVEEIQNYYNHRLYYLEQEKEINALLKDKKVTETEWNSIVLEKEQKTQGLEEIKLIVSKKTYEVEQLDKEYLQWNSLEIKRKELQNELDVASELNKVLKGNALVDFVAQEYLRNIIGIASDKLLQLTRNRYSLDLDQDSGFIIVDHTNAGLARPVQSLSGGETFITSLALALALSSQIQLNGGQPLQFFFLDEGFGTLDGDLLDTVMMTLEKLQAQHMTIGIISHVPELQNRLLRKIMVQPPDAKGTGSIIKIES